MFVLGHNWSKIGDENSLAHLPVANFRSKKFKIQTAHAVSLLTMVVANARLMPDDDDGDDAHDDFDESQLASEGTECGRRKSTGEE